MIAIDLSILTPLAARYLATRRGRLSPSERVEVIRIVQGFGSKDSAAASGVSYETIRARRKRIYRKLGMTGVNELLSSLLGFALKLLASGERIAPQEAPGSFGDDMAGGSSS